MKVFKNKITRRLGETQFGNDSEVLIKNARNCGYSEEEIEIIEISEEEYRIAIKIQNENDLSYSEKRRKEYPKTADYLDAKVKQGSFIENIKEEGIKQEQDYINKCLDVKLKYPKI